MTFYCPYGFYDQDFFQSDLNHDGSLDQNDFSNLKNADSNLDGHIDSNEMQLYRENL
jgi:hypothetical protein